MFERFTDRARRVMILAQEEARMLNHNHVGTEHLLLGLIHEGEGVAAKALEALGISLEAVRQQVEEEVGRGEQAPPAHIRFTPRAKKVLELSLRDALLLGHHYIGTEHILLGLIREGEGLAAQVLAGLGADLERVRQQVIELLRAPRGEQRASEAGMAVPVPEARQKVELTKLVTRADSIESRLAALEQRVGTGPDQRELDEQIADARRQKESAAASQNYERAATLRKKETELQAQKDSGRKEWMAAHPGLPALADECRRLMGEVERLHALLRQHGIEEEGSGS